MTKYFWLVIFLGLMKVLNAQLIPTVSLTKNADQNFENFAYAKALELYKEAYQRDSTSTYVIAQISRCYIKLNDSRSSEVWLKKLVLLNPKIEREYFFLLAEQLSKNEKYEEAYQWYEKSGDEKSLRKMRGIEKISSLNGYGKKYSINLMEFNAQGVDFGPMYYENGVAFVSSRTKQQWVRDTYNWDGSDYLDFYFFDSTSQSLEIQKLEDLNTKLHEGPGQLFNNGNNIVFTRNNVINRKPKKDDRGVTKLQIYFAGKDDRGKWTNASPFQHNKKDYSLGHPTITESGDTLIYASDKPGGFGGTDLYMVTATGDSTWSQPLNLGEKINTQGNEMFPYLIGNRLYFASNGREGLGGLDIYMSRHSKLVNWEDPVNLGTPFNSSQDDFGLICDRRFKTGYFTSDRNGSDDIYDFKSHFISITGKVLFDSILTGISNARVTIQNSKGSFKMETLSDVSGSFNFEVPQNDTLVLLAEKENYKLVSLVSMLPPLNDNKQLNPLLMRQALLKFRVIDQKTLANISDPSIRLTDISYGEEVQITQKTDTYYQILPGKDYEIFISRDGYYTHRDTVFTDSTYWGFNSRVIELKPIVVGESIRLEHIYYDVNSANLRLESELELDKVVVFLNDNSHLKIEMSSHTDSRGNAAYNQNLSQRRAESATKYLIMQGIDPDRIIPRGYGERKLINRCRDGVKCPNDEHQENRRTEIKILEDH